MVSEESACCRHVGVMTQIVRSTEMWKYAGELRVGDVWTERTGGRDMRSYRVIAIAPGLALTSIRVTGSCVTTGQRRTMDCFLVSRVEVSRRTEASEAASHCRTGR